MTIDVTVVVPTLGRPTLEVLLRSLAEASGPRAVEVVLVDDRPDPVPSLASVVHGHGLAVVRVLRSGGRGPAAARNVGWCSARTTWIAFVDDDVVVDDDWWTRLEADLRDASGDVAAVQGRLTVPLDHDRRPTDWERGTRGLETAAFITADMAVRRASLVDVGGFDERFTRAYREDTDLALRLLGGGWRICRGSRSVRHPVRPADDWVSVRQQAGNADDVLMRRLHGPEWRTVGHAPRGRRGRNVATASALFAAVGAAAVRRPRASLAAGAAWSVLTTELAAARIAPGPRDGAEVRRMLVTSAAIPVAATWHLLRGAVVHRRVNRAGSDGRASHHAGVEPADGAAQAVLEPDRRAPFEEG